MKYADKIFFNGRIHTMDKDYRVVEALAIKEDSILKVGSSGEILKLKGDRTNVYDLKGKAIIPGIIDTHAHIFWAGVSELYEKLFVPRSIEELLSYVDKKAREIPKGEWIHLKNIYPTRLKEYRYPTIEELDRVSPNHPVFIDGAYAGRVNSYALKHIGLEREASIGKIIDKVRKSIVSRKFDLKDHKEGIKNIQRKYNAFGITSIIDGSSSDIGIKAINELYYEDQLDIRLSFTHVTENKENTVENIKRLESFIKIPKKWGRLDFLKITLDGGILTGTSYMRNPYIDNIDIFEIDEGFKGLINYDTVSIEKFIDIAYKKGYQMTAHCIGDGALDILLKSYSNYQQTNDIRGRRFSIIHGDFTDDSALIAIKKLGLSLLFQPAWHFKDAYILKKVLDEETFQNFLPYKKYIDFNIAAAAGSDHMVKYDSLLSQNPYNPFWGMYNMITAKTMDGHIIGEEYSVDRDEALKFYTSKASYVTFDEDVKGSLEAGKLADFSVLSKDYFTCPLEEIPNITSVHTIVGGRTVYSSCN
ncbi:MAG: amidohydrolase [Clostridiales bacterium]|nr:amidohydrolase [Clostridiales bacterium]